LSVSASADAIERPAAPLRETVPGLRIETQAYPDQAATEWQFRLRAPEAGESPLYENLKSADFEVAFPPDAKVRLQWNKGSHSEPGDFEPKTNPLVVGEVFSLESFGGRSSDGVMPYFNLASEGGGLIFAVGWTGDWKASFELQANGKVRVIADDSDAGGGRRAWHLSLQRDLRRKARPTRHRHRCAQAAAGLLSP
jgi:alpha-galactosidase